jgi:hypothetical protein
MSAGSVNPLTPGTGQSTVATERFPSTAPLLLWLVIQLGAILIAALRVPLAAGYPEPAERLAPYLLLAVQVAAVGMLFPFLLRDWRSAVQVVTTAVPFQLSAGYLAGLAVRAMLPAMTFALSWIVVLAIWRTSLRTRQTRVSGICLATCLTLGGGILRYLRLEFGPGSDPGSPLENASPLLTTFAALDGQPTFQGWLTLAALAVSGGCVWVLVWNIQRKMLRESLETRDPRQ